MLELILICSLGLIALGSLIRLSKLETKYNNIVLERKNLEINYVQFRTGIISSLSKLGIAITGDIMDLNSSNITVTKKGKII